MFFDEKDGFQFNELARRLANLIRLGSVKEVDYSRARARVAIGDIITDWLPWLAGFAGNSQEWHPLDIGEQVVVLAPSGDLCQGVILKALYKRNAPSQSGTLHTTHYADGSQVSFDAASGNFIADIKGNAQIKVGGQVILEASNTFIKSSQITLEGDVIINGNMIGNGTMSLGGKGGASVARVGDSVEVNSQTHKGTITSGSSKVTAG
jgi:phage baseplate assembly protein V